MKKYFIALSIVISTALAPVIVIPESHASGVISTEMRVYFPNAVHPVFGLKADEQLVPKLKLNAWAGYGDRPTSPADDSQWFGVKSYLDFDLGDFILGIGGGVAYGFERRQSESHMALRLDHKLW